MSTPGLPSAPPTVIVDAAEYLKLIRSDSKLRQELKELKQQYDWRMEDIGKIRAAFTGITKEDSLIDFAAKTSAKLTATQAALNEAREVIETELKFAEFEQRQRLRAALAQIDAVTKAIV